MKKILMISNKVMHYRVSVYNYFYTHFKEDGYEFSVISNKLQEANMNRLLFPFEEIPFIFKKYRNAVKRIKPDYIILFLHMKDILLWPLINWLKWKKIPVIIWTKGVNLDDPDNPVKYLFFNYLHTKADGLILYSAREKKYIKEKNKHKISVAPNTINFTDFPAIKDTPARIKKELQIPFKKVVLFVGRMGIAGGRKKIDHLIDIFSEIDNKDYGLIIIGSGLSGELQARLNKKNTMYLSEVHDPENILISKYFKIADVFSIPGHIGLGINHAFHWGLPVVTEEGKQPPEITYLEDGRNGFLVGEDDIKALKEKILLLLKDDALRKRMSQCAIEDIEKNGSIDGMYRGFLESVEKINNTKTV